MKIDGIAAMIAGGASGLGAATARHLIAAGARCAILDRDERALRKLAAELGDNAVPIVGNIVNDDDVLRALRAIDDRPLRMAVVCAFAGSVDPVLSSDGVAGSMDSFRRVIDVNLTGSFNVLRLAAQEISKTDPGEDGERGLVVLTSSIAAFDGTAPQIAYTASKMAVAGMTLSAARDLAPHGIRVMTIAPGTFGTPAVLGLPQVFQDSLAGQALFPARLGRPEEFGQIVAFIAQCTFLNAEVIRLDGGARLPAKV